MVFDYLNSTYSADIQMKYIDLIYTKIAMF